VTLFVTLLTADWSKFVLQPLTTHYVSRIIITSIGMNGVVATLYLYMALIITCQGPGYPWSASYMEMNTAKNQTTGA